VRQLVRVATSASAIHAGPMPPKMVFNCQREGRRVRRGVEYRGGDVGAPVGESSDVGV
jgi:hypothetical protein